MQVKIIDMKLIDKYILKTFLPPFVYCLAAFVIIYVVYDLFDHLPDFIQSKTPLIDVAKFYALLIPSVVAFIVPVSLLLSVLYSLSQLTRHNELTAMRASGVSLYRLMAPFVAGGLLASLAVAVVHETIGPWSAYRTSRFVLAQKQKGVMDVHITHELALKNVKTHRDWFIHAFNQTNYHMEQVRITQLREDGSELFKITAKEGRWLDGRWWLVEPVILRFNENGDPQGLPERKNRSMELSDFTETPKDFLHEAKDTKYLTSRDLWNYIQAHQHFGEKALAALWVDFHYRLATPWACLVATLIGIPFGNQTGRKGAFWGIVLCLSLFLGYYLFINLGLYLGKTQRIPPWTAAWGQNILFLMTGLVLSYKIR